MNRLWIAALLLVSLLAVPQKILAQGGPSSQTRSFTLTGTVYSEDGKRPVFQARIQLCDAGGTAIEEVITDDSGQFSFRQIRPSMYVLTVNATGMEQETLHFDLSMMSERGISIYLKPIAAPASAPASSISAHELSLPQEARDLMASGKKKLYVDKDAKAGLSDFERAVVKAPGFYEAYYEIGMAQLTLGHRDDAQRSFRKSIEVSNDKYAEPVIGLGTLLLDTGDPQSEKLLRHGLELNPNAWLGHYELGRSLMIQNRIPEAEKSADQARTLAPNVTLVYRLLSNIHLREKNYPALIEDLDAYIKLDPDSSAGVRAKEIREETQKKMNAAVATPDRLTNPSDAKP